MIRQKLPNIICAALLGAGSVTAAQVSTAEEVAEAEPTLASALENGKVALSLRYRLENVDQEGLSEDANASTLRTRLSWESGNYQGFSATLEMDDVTAVGEDNYNSTTNGKIEYPVVADPEGTEVNQAYLQYSKGAYKANAGRQRIVLDNQRFVGGVAWRQNEQTFDGYRFRYGDTDSLQLDYSYVYNVNRIFGEESGKGDLEGDIQILHTSYQVNEDHKLVFFVLDLELDEAVDDSSRTLGLMYNGNLGPVKAQLSYAQQNETGDSALDYSAPYYMAELGADLGPVNARLGYEVLGSDNGVGFSTQLATLHKFQGFADQFLVTPADGVEDLYAGVAATIAGGKLDVTYHNFTAEETSVDWGEEWDLSYSHKITDQLSALIKYANYSADSHGVDTDKVWLMLTANF